jgi:hypothetical protein
VLIRPYIDMEYFQHPEGAMFHEPMGRLEVSLGRAGTSWDIFVPKDYNSRCAISCRWTFLTRGS